MTDHEMRELFREMREEPVPADSLARVRARVDRRLSRRGWKIAAAVLVAAACAAGFVMFRPAMPVPPPMIAVIPAPVAPVEEPIQVVSRPRHVRPRLVKAVPVLIRIETPDPDVVILLVN